MKKTILFFLLSSACIYLQATSQTEATRPAPKYDTIIRKHVTKPIIKAKEEIVMPSPEFINQPYERI